MFAGFAPSGSPSPSTFSSPSPYPSPGSPSRPAFGLWSSRCRADSEASTAATDIDAEAGGLLALGGLRAHKPRAWPLEQPLLRAPTAAGRHDGVFGAPCARKLLTALGAAALLLSAAGLGALAGWSACISWRPGGAAGFPTVETGSGRPEQPQQGVALLPGERRRLSVLGRDVWAYLPSAAAAADGPALPAVVVLHGSEDYALSIAKTSRFEALAESSSEPFLAVFPEMATPGGEVWDYTGDVPFFRAMVDHLGSQFNLSRSEVYVCGHSAGGSMSIFLQNKLPDVFHGAAAVEAGIGGEKLWDDESSGRPTMVVWNHNDPVLNVYGGEALLNRTLSKLRRRASSAAADDRPSYSFPVATSNASVVKGARQLLYGASGGAPPVSVVSWETVEPTHHWANPENVPGAFDAAALVWQFFRSTRVSERP